MLDPVAAAVLNDGDLAHGGDGSMSRVGIVGGVAVRMSSKCMR